jgi:hypothetical protein
MISIGCVHLAKYIIVQSFTYIVLHINFLACVAIVLVAALARHGTNQYISRGGYKRSSNCFAGVCIFLGEHPFSSCD